MYNYSQLIGSALLKLMIFVHLSDIEEEVKVNKEITLVFDTDLEIMT